MHHASCGSGSGVGSGLGGVAARSGSRTGPSQKNQYFVSGKAVIQLPVVLRGTARAPSQSPSPMVAIGTRRCMLYAAVRLWLGFSYFLAVDREDGGPIKD